MKIIAIIVTYNAMKWVDRCLGSIRDSYLPIQTVVVDNGSTDGTRDYLPARYPDVVWMPQSSNLGFGQANNIGLRYALEQEADYVLLLNQDAWINSEMLVQLLRFSDGRTLLSPIHLNGQGDDFDRNFCDNTIRRSSTISSLRQLRDGVQLTPFNATAVAAACWFVPISIIREVGGFNPLFFQYGEDHNYLDRVAYHGFEVKVIPTTFVRHDRDQYGHPELFKRQLVYRYLLIHYTDINHRPTLSGALHVCGFWCREGIHQKHLFAMIRQSVSGLWQIWRRRKQIKDSRIEEQQTQPTWL